MFEQVDITGFFTAKFLTEIVYQFGHGDRQFTTAQIDTVLNNQGLSGMFCYQLVTDNELRNIFTFPGKVFSACTPVGYI